MKETEQHIINGTPLPEGLPPSAEAGDGELGDDETRFVALARMARRRRQVAAPDVDRAWRNLPLTIGTRQAEAPADDGNHGRRGARVWQMFIAAVAGAAAMLVGVVCYSHFFAPQKPSADNLVVMKYDTAPQEVTLVGDKGKMTLKGRDSVSFAKSGATANPSGKAKARSVIQRLSTPRGMTFKVILPDNSEVWLNAGSTIEFPSAFTESERLVALKGEAYFKVSHNPQAPFIVETEQMNIRVLGTEFDMKCYESETPSVALVNGSVEVIDKDKQQTLASLKPNEGAWLNRQGQLRTGTIDVYALTQWASGFFYFNDEPLVNVLRELARWYNMGVEFKSPSLMGIKIHFSASHDGTIADAVGDINRLHKVNVSIEGNSLVVR